jgi:uncharacterized protein (TIGR02996 family)
MNTREILLAALADDPEDATAWLALADCLEEEGHLQHAELSRLTRQLPTLKGAPRRTAEDRVIALLASGLRPVVPEVVNSIGLRLVYIPPGRFRMGSPTREPRRMDDEPLHTVRLTRGFWMGRYPVTQKEYRQVTGKKPSSFNRRRQSGKGVEVERCPVESVSWAEALAFTQQLSSREQERGWTYHLPTEAQWEYACRGGIGTRYPFHLGATLRHGQANFASAYPFPPHEEDPEATPLGHPCPVGQFTPNAWGLYDMHGNVDEWCHDWYDHEFYTQGETVDPTGPPDGDGRILRGGSFRGQGEDCRAAVRIGYTPTEGFPHVGFRVIAQRLPGHSAV